MRILRLLGIGISVLFISSFITLFYVNPQTYEELNYLGITSFNLIGFAQQLPVALINYTLIGALIIFFGLKLSLLFKNSHASKYGSYLIILSGLAWASFGLLPLDADTNPVFGSYHMIRIAISWASGIIGLILLSVDLDRVFKPKNLKWLSLVVSILMLCESIYLIWSDYSGIISAIAWAIYMSWFAVFTIFSTK